MTDSTRSTCGLVVAALMVAAALPVAQQRADPDFDVSVTAPAYTATHPRVVIDEAHHNFHTAGGRYEPFARLLRNDGYDVRAGTTPFTASSLAGAGVLVISNALGAGATVNSDSSPPAFTNAECDAVLAWVKSGGSLLLVSDHTPMGEANAALAARFGVTMGKGAVLMVAESHRGANPTQLVFSRENGLLADHPITRGRGDAERIRVVRSFTGQSLSVPAGATPLLKLGPDAWESPTRSELRAFAAEIAGGTPDPATLRTSHAVAVPDKAQGIAFDMGKGRVVMLGEAAMLSAQVSGANGQGRMGMNVPGSDDKQFALSVLHWLSHLI